MSPRNSTAPDGRVRDEMGMNQGRSGSYHQHDSSVPPGLNSNMRTGQLSPRPLPPNVRYSQIYLENLIPLICGSYLFAFF